MSLIVSPQQFAQRAEFYHQLNQYTSAGIPIVRALEQIKRSPPAALFRKPLQGLLDGLARGSTLAESLQPLNWLPEFDLALIGAGEKSGKLDTCFRTLTEYYNDRARVIRQVIAHLIYPVVLVHLAAFVFLIVLPFAHSQFNASLTLLFAKAVLFLSPFYGAVAALVYATQSKHGEKWRALVESALRLVPLLGKARHFLALSRLAASLEALISAGVNIFEAWDLAATASGSPALRRAVTGWKPQLIAGQMPSEAVNRCQLFPETFANLYASGEISGKLDESLRNLHRLYGEDGTRKLNTFAALVPRLIYFLIAIVIGYEVIQFYSSRLQEINDASQQLYR